VESNGGVGNLGIEAGTGPLEEFSSLVVSLSTGFINLSLEDIDEGIMNALRSVGQYCAVDRSYIFLFSDDRATMSNTHEWCAPGIEPQRYRLQRVPLESLPWFSGKMMGKERVYVPVVESLPPEATAEKREFEIEGIKSLVVVPMVLKGLTVGCVGLDSVASSKAWERKDIDLLEIVADMLANALDRKRTGELLRDQQQRYGNLLETMSTGTFQVDSSGRLVEADGPLARLLGFDTPGALVASGRSILDRSGGSDTEGAKWKALIGERDVAMNVERQVAKKDGTPIWISLNVSALRNEGGAIRAYEGMAQEITERKSIENARAQSDARYRAIFENANDAILVIRGDNFIDCNPRSLEMFRCSREEIIGQPPFSFSPLLQPDGSDSIEGSRRKIRQALAGVPQSFAWKHSRADGDLFDAEVSLTRLEVGGGVFLQSIVRDLTEEKKAEQALKDSQQYLRDILSYLPDATMVVDPDGRIVIWNRAMEEMTGVAGDEVVGRGEYCYAVPFYGIRRPILVDLALRQTDSSIERLYPMVKREGETLFTEVYTTVFKTEGAYLWAKAKPLKDGDGKLIGAIETVRDITERKNAERAVQKAFATMHAILEHAPIGVMVANEKGAIEYANPAMAAISGISVERLRSINIFDLPTYEAAGLTERIRNSMAGKPFRLGPLEYTSYYGGKTTIRNFTGVPVEEDGVKKVLVFVEDVTDQKRVEALLQSERETFHTILQKAPSGVILAAKDGTFLYLNPEFTAITGYSLEDVPSGKVWFKKAYPDKLYRREVIRTWVGDMSNPGIDRVFRIRCGDGTEKDVEFRPSMLEDGKSVTMMTDITGRRAAEQLFRTLADNSPAGVYVIQDGLFRFVNPYFLRITGYGEEDLLGHSSMSFVAAEDKVRLRDMAVQMLRGESSSGYEYRVFDKKGDPHWILESVTSIHFGGRRAVLGTFIEITELKTAERLLRESEERYRILTERSPVGVYVFQDGVFRYVNRAFADIHGREIDEMVGQFGFEGSMAADEMDALKETLAGLTMGMVENIRCEFRIEQKGGTLRSVEMRGALAAFEGRPAVLGTLIDVTDRKELETRLKLLSMIDELTGLQNRRGFVALAEQQVRLAVRGVREMVLFYLDLDGLKEINDTYGHIEGDKALINLASMLRRSFREADIIGRVGGDEFAVLAIDAGEEAAGVFESRLERNVEAYNKKSIKPYPLRVSVGFAYFDPQSPCTLDDLVGRADSLMYLQKRAKGE
jgi:diguanylate cyclase (GGDEF)-like protein/PAS domain S-box-containing protein